MKVLKYLRENIIVLFIALQPVVDIFAYVQSKFCSTSYSWIIRLVLLFLIVINCFFKTQDKKRFICKFLPFIIFIVIHILNLFRINALNLYLDLKYYSLIVQMPILTLLFIEYSKFDKKMIDKIEKGISIAFLVIFFSMALAFLTSSYETTYAEIGFLGWFTGSSTPSMILCAICPFVVHYFAKQRSRLIYVFVCIAVFIILFFNATRACYLTLFLSFGVSLFNALVKNKKQIFYILIPSIFLILSIILYPYSYTYYKTLVSNNINDINQNIIDNVIENANDNQSTDIDNQEINTGNTETKEENITDKNIAKKQAIEILKTSYLYKELIDIHGEDIIYEKTKNILNSEMLSDNRIRKKINAKIEFQKSDVATKILGFGYSRVNQYNLDLENDLTAIYYYYGYLGFGLYCLFILYFIGILLKRFIASPRLIQNEAFVLLGLLVLFLLFGGEYSGAFLRKPNSNIYLSLYLTLIYLNFFQINKTNINNNKISFLLLHLGYGGIETATINTANALCDKYEIELISFYNLDDNQTHLINKKIKIKYLYNGSPNKNQFIDSIKKVKILSILKEGFKAINILLKKKILIIKEIVSSNSFAIVSTRWDFSVLLSRYGSKNIIKIAQEHHHHNNNLKYIKILKYQYKNIDYLCALTKTLRKDYINFLDKTNKKTQIVLLPNMLTDFPKKTSTLKNKNIISVGRLHEGKKIDELIKIFSLLETKKSKLYIIGDGDEEKKLTEMIKTLNLKNRVILTGYLNKEQQKKYFLDSCVFVMTSISEGLPMVLLEAMQYGLPCIAYETESGIKDIITNNKNGYIIKNRNEVRFREKLDYMLQNDEDLQSKSKEALITARKYSKENILQSWDKILCKEFK